MSSLRAPRRIASNRMRATRDATVTIVSDDELWGAPGPEHAERLGIVAPKKKSTAR